MGTFLLVHAHKTKYLNQWNGWVVCHISKPKITFNTLARPTQKESPKPILMMMENIESDYDPNEDNGG